MQYRLVSCDPQSERFFSPTALKSLVDIYNLNEDAIEMEASLTKMTLEESLISNQSHIYYPLPFL